MTGRLARILRFAALLLVAGSAVAAPASIPALTSRITDTTGTLNREQVTALEQRLAAFEARKGVQLAVLMVPSTRPETIEQYALRVAEQWKLGRSKVDDGALLVVAKEDRTLRIEVGYGLEGVLPDLTANRIINEFIVPRFAQGDFAGGISAGLDRMMAVIEGEPLPAPAQQRVPPGGEELPPFLPVLVILALVSAAVLRGWMGRGPAAVLTGGVVGAAAWVLAGTLATALIAAALAALFSLAGGPGLLAALGRGHGHGGWGGGGGRGGFRGGGGGFGGGGSSGRW